jgi:hypothetical protein
MEYSFQQNCCDNWISTCKRLKLNFFTPYTNIKVDKNVNVNSRGQLPFPTWGEGNVSPFLSLLPLLPILSCHTKINPC